ncbi:MAG: DUF2064 domain-containing protein [Chitinivibrionales bacterium]|nr:DUF2064 domain-containing protein [Chitinivibrionales bacterium]
MEDNKRIALVLFAKVPGLGIAKSRIAAQSDAHTAATAYAELLDVVSGVLRGQEYHVSYTGSDAPGPLRRAFPDAASFFPQPVAPLGERLRAAMHWSTTNGYLGMIAIGCDCPTLTRNDIDTARHALTDGADVVLGPAEDGGYYLAGCTARGAVIFSARQWSSPGLFAETLEIVRREKLVHRLLDRRADIDTLADYTRWKETP